MSKKDKLKARLLSKPKDFTWKDAVTLMNGYGFDLLNGKGSRRKFYNKETQSIAILHEPHPTKILLEYAVKELIKILKENGDI